MPGKFSLIILPSSKEIGKVIFFSYDFFPIEPGSFPPCPGSITIVLTYTVNSN